MPKDTTKLELSFDELDGEILRNALAKALEIKPSELIKTTKGIRMLEEKGFDGFMKIMRTYIESN